MNEHASASLSSPSHELTTLPRLLKSQAHQRPNAIALLAPGRPPLTYGRLLTHVQTVAATLKTQGLGPQDRVAIVLPNGPEMAISFLAVSFLATAAPVNPSYRTREYDSLFEDLQPKCLLMQGGLDLPFCDTAMKREIPIVEIFPNLDDEAGSFHLPCANDPPPVLHHEAQPQDLALILPTSGTTARPKLVPLTHANLCISAKNVASSLQLCERDRCLNLMPLFHIHGLVGAVLASLQSGGSVACTPGFQGDRFWEWLQEILPTWYTAVPTIHQAILAEAQSGSSQSLTRKLRLIRSSSAALPPSVLKNLEKTFHCPVIEAYGMTEAAHQMASNPLPPGKRKPGSVGIAAGPDIGILNEQGERIPSWVKGEIVIKGPNVTDGYMDNPEANNRAFDRGWFRTGDEGYMDEDGYVFLTGRLKEMINRGGEKIAPREVEEALLSYPGVAQAVAFGMPHPTLGEEVAAAVVLKNSDQGKERILQDFVREYIAEWKVPRRIVEVKELPKGPTGKLHRNRMAEILGLGRRPTVGTDSEFSLNEDNRIRIELIETVVTEIYGEVLGIPEVDIQGNFFEMGGDSLSAARIINRLQERLNLELGFVVIFQKPTVRELSREIRTLLDTGVS